MFSSKTKQPLNLKPPNFAVVSTIGCKFCQRAKILLRQNKLAFKEYDLTNQQAEFSKFKNIVGSATLPQIFYQRRRIGGHQDLENFLKVHLDDVINNYPIDLEDRQELDSSQQEYAKDLDKKCQLLPDDIEDIIGGLTRQEKILHFQIEEDQKPILDEHGDIILYLYENIDQFKYLKKSNEFLDKDLAYMRNCFTGHQLVEFLMSSFPQKFTDSKEATKFGQELINHRILTHLIKEESDIQNDFPFQDNFQYKYKFVKDCGTPGKGVPLNLQFYWVGKARHPQKVAEDLQNIIQELYDRYVSINGKTIEYQALKQDDLFQKYVLSSNELHKVDIGRLDREQKMAFFINIYNALVVHALAVHGYPKNLSQRFQIYKDYKYIIGSHKYSCDDIEHGILRGDQVAPSLFNQLLQAFQLGTQTYFKPQDDRQKFAIAPMDPRIHFALNCGAKSCPPISVYDAQNLNSALDSASENFVQSGGLKIVKGGNKVILSQIFKWYSKDFADNPRSMLNYIRPYATQDDQSQLEQILRYQSLKIEYEKYNWDTNIP